MRKRRACSLTQKALDAVFACANGEMTLSGLLNEDAIHPTPREQGIIGQLDAVCAVVRRVEFAAHANSGRGNPRVIKAAVVARQMVPSIEALLKLLRKMGAKTEMEFLGIEFASKQCSWALDVLNKSLPEWGY